MAVVDATESDFPTSYEQYQNGEWPYDVVPLNPDEHDDAITWQGLHEFGFTAEDGEIYAGCYPRAMINNAAYTEQPLMIGASARGNKSVGILHRERYRHVFCGGQTGAGKSVAAKCAVQQDALAGHGCCVIDPGGEDIIDIVRSLPEYRLDDVIYMEPGNEYREYSIGLNYLDTFHKPGEPGYGKECESIATNLLPMLEADEYARMKGVASNMLRYLIKADHEDDAYEYTLIDLYYILASDEARQAYAHQVNQSKLAFLKPYATKIADLAGDDLEPLIRRLQSWVENDVIRPFIAQRDSDFSIADAVENQRIILVKANLGKSEREMVTAALTTKLWSAITSRPGEDERKMMEFEGVDVPTIGGNDDTGEHKPFFLVADEFHAVASENTDIGEMLAMARKKGLGLYILTQQLSQLTSEQQEQILGNCSTLMAFDPGRSPNERRALASGFEGVEESDLGIGRFKYWTTLTNKEGDESQPFLTYSIPPYPPVRTVKAANAALNRAQKRHGSKRLTTDEILQQVPDEFSPAAAKASLSGEDKEPTLPEKPSPGTRALVCKAVYDAAYRAESGDGWIPLDDAHDRIRNYLETSPSPYDPETPSKTREILKHVDPDALESADRDDGTGVSVRCTSLGKRLFTSGGNTFDPDPEAQRQIQENEGSWAHLQLIQDAYDELLDIGLLPTVPAQDGGAMPDALLSLADIEVPDVSNELPFDAIREAIETFIDEYPTIYRLTSGSETFIELEKSTANSDPGQTVMNLVKAANEDKRCLFLTRPSTAENVWQTLKEEPRFCRTDWSVHGQDRLYNRDDLTIPTEDGMETMYRPAGPSQTIWVRDGSRYRLLDSDRNEHAVFASAEDVVSKIEKYPHHTAENVDSDEWSPIKRPVIPRHVFKDGIPDPSTYDVVTVYSDETPLQLYESGTETPLAEVEPQENVGASTVGTATSSSTGSAGGSATTSGDESVLDQL